MRSNEDLQKDIQHAIAWQPKLCATDIGVICKQGIITLTGIVDTYAKKDLVENAAKNVMGVKAIVNNITVTLSRKNIPADEEIAKAINDAIKWHWDISSQHLRVTVENGFVTLEGEVNWAREKEAARKTVSSILGVKGILNNIQLCAEPNAVINVRDIEKALFRNAAINDEDIKVEIKDGSVYLTGSVPSLFQKDEAEKMAWNAPGVAAVHNFLNIEPTNY